MIDLTKPLETIHGLPVILSTEPADACLVDAAFKVRFKGDDGMARNYAADGSYAGDFDKSAFPPIRNVVVSAPIDLKRPLELSDGTPVVLDPRYQPRQPGYQFIDVLVAGVLRSFSQDGTHYCEPNRTLRNVIAKGAPVPQLDFTKPVIGGRPYGGRKVVVLTTKGPDPQRPIVFHFEGCTVVRTTGLDGAPHGLRNTPPPVVKETKFFNAGTNYGSMAAATRYNPNWDVIKVELVNGVAVSADIVYQAAR